MQPANAPLMSGGDTPQRERLPSFLLTNSSPAMPPVAPTPSSSTFPFTPARAPPQEPAAGTTAQPSWPFQSRRTSGPSILFNDRLRHDRADASAHGMPSSASMLPMADVSMGSANVDAHRTPSRMPPNKSLLDSGPPSVMHLRTPSMSPMVGTPGSFARHTSSSPGMVTPGSTSAATDLPRWITVFGFARDMESQALREFRRHGDIVRTVPGKGNWVHLLYRTPLQAQVALYKPWRVLAGTDIMVGAVACTEPTVAMDVDENVERGILVASPSANGMATPRVQPELGSMSGPSPARPGLPTPSTVLRRDHGQSVNQSQSIVRTPQRQTGIFEYIAGFYK